MNRLPFNPNVLTLTYYLYSQSRSHPIQHPSPILSSFSSSSDDLPFPFLTSLVLIRFWEVSQEPT